MLESLLNLPPSHKVAVAYSAGVDSTYLLYEAHALLGDRVIAITVSSSAFPAEETAEAAWFCLERGISHEIVDFDPMSVQEFVENGPKRCYFCKRAMFGKIIERANALGADIVLEGSNLDDEFDYRPGKKALEELGVFSPLKNSRLTKSDIRRLSREAGLLTAEKPAMACLATRFPFVVRLTREALCQIAAAEAFLAKIVGFNHQRRVRVHGDIARIEVEPESFPKILENADAIRREFGRLGFGGVVLDLAGYRKGSMNGPFHA